MLNIGLNFSFYTYNLYPLYKNFFNGIGCEVVLPNHLDVEGLNYEFSQLCYPMELSLQSFLNLCRQKVDYIFLPAVFEMDAEQDAVQRLDFNCACAFVTGEPYIMKQAFKEEQHPPVISPSLNFANGLDKEENKFIDIARQVGCFDVNKARTAYQNAIVQQNLVQQKLLDAGKKFMEDLDNEEFGIILLGRGYNSCADIANKGIPRKFASRGINILPMDMLDMRNIPHRQRMYWEVGHRLLHVAELIRDNPKLFAVYVTNFSCAPDSMLLNTFRKIMGAKPSLTLELDSHSADAGINTRIDAFIDIVRNYKHTI
jgi:predicted nucleotide-binding protein (sugar kinase/HSP70/actin superfamily)